MNPNDFDDSKRTAPKFSGILNGGKEGQYRSSPGTVPNGRFPSNLVMSHDPRCIARGTKRVPIGGGKHIVGKPHKPANIYGQFETVQGPYYGDEHGQEEVPAFECVENCPVRVLGEQSGESKSKAAPRGGTSPNPMSWGEIRKDGNNIAGYEDEGSKARYFQQFHDPLSSLEAPFHYFSKSSRRDRNSGLEGMPKSASSRYGKMNGTSEHAPKYDTPEQNTHPTCKPTSLISWLCTLITPPGGIILDPFFGSGTLGVCAVRNGFHFIGIEQEQEYVNIARARIAHAMQEVRSEESEGQEYMCVEECPIKVLDTQSGKRPSSGRHGKSGSGNKTGLFGMGSTRQQTYFDEGGASRYFTQLAPEPICLWDLLEECGS